jgi:hypothetical protein
MSADRFIYSESYIRGRIYSYLKFKKYMKEISDIFCEEFHLDKSQVLGVNLSEDGKTVYLDFEDGEIGFASEMLWDQNVRETFRKSFEVD